MQIESPVLNALDPAGGPRPDNESDIPTLTTPRLVLRALTSADAEPLHKLMDDPAVMRYFPNPNPPGRVKINRLIDGQLEHWHEHAYGWWAITRREDDVLLGWCGLQHLPETDEVEVAYLLGAAHWGRGYASEAAQASLAFGFESLNLQRIVAIVHPGNRASQRVLERIGMQFLDRQTYFGMDCFRYVGEPEPAG